MAKSVIRTGGRQARSRPRHSVGVPSSSRAHLAPVRTLQPRTRRTSTPSSKYWPRESGPGRLDSWYRRSVTSPLSARPLRSPPAIMDTVNRPEALGERCLPQYVVLDNAAGQNPCQLARSLIDRCDSSAWEYYPLGPLDLKGGRTHYPIPGAEQVSPCLCSMGVYNLVQACAACQQDAAYNSTLVRPFFAPFFRLGCRRFCKVPTASSYPTTVARLGVELHVQYGRRWPDIPHVVPGRHQGARLGLDQFGQRWPQRWQSVSLRWLDGIVGRRLTYFCLSSYQHATSNNATQLGSASAAASSTSAEVAATETTTEDAYPQQTNGDYGVGGNQMDGSSDARSDAIAAAGVCLRPYRAPPATGLTKLLTQLSRVHSSPGSLSPCSSTSGDGDGACVFEVWETALRRP